MERTGAGDLRDNHLYDLTHTHTPHIYVHTLYILHYLIISVSLCSYNLYSLVMIKCVL